MTVGNLKAILDCYDDEQKIVIGQRQNFGSNFVYNICEDVEENRVRKFYGRDINSVVMLIMGSQIGVIKESYDNEEDDDDYNDENLE